MAEVSVFVWYGNPDDIVEGEMLVELEKSEESWPKGVWETVERARLRPHEDSGDTASFRDDPIGPCADYRVKFSGTTWYGADIEAFKPSPAISPDGQNVCGGESRNWGRDIVREDTDMVEVEVTVEDPEGLTVGDVSVRLQKFLGAETVDKKTLDPPGTVWLRNDPGVSVDDPGGHCATYRLRVDGTTSDGAQVVRETPDEEWCDFQGLSEPIILTGDDVQVEIVETKFGRFQVDKTTVPVGDTMRFIGTLEEERLFDVGVADARVDIENVDTGEILATGRTDGAGDFAIPWQPGQGGEVTTRAVFNGLTRGGKVLQPSTSRSVTVTVEREAITINLFLEDPDNVVDGEAEVRLVKSLRVIGETVDTEFVDPPGTATLSNSPVGDCADYSVEVEATSPRGNPVSKTLSERRLCRGTLSMTVTLSSSDEEQPGEARIRITAAQFEAPVCESDVDVSAEVVASVRNEGDRAGSATVQLSAVDPSGSVAASTRRTVTLGAGDTGEVSSGAVVLSKGTWSPVAEVVT